jgi:hypothetical protein
MKMKNIVYTIYLILYPIFLIIDFNFKEEVYVGLVALFILYLLLNRQREIKMYKNLAVKFYLTATGGLMGLSKSILMIGFLIIFLGLSYLVFRQDLYHTISATTIGILCYLGTIVYFFSSLKTSCIKITEDGIIDSDDTILIPYSKLFIDHIKEKKFKIVLKHRDNAKRFSILVDKSSEIGFNELVNYFKSRISIN